MNDPKAEEQARRTRSLERNHRHLVTIDSTCRYSREVGSNQLHLITDVQSSRISDQRYHPDPTCRRPLTSSSSSASTSSSASSTHSNPEPLHSRRRRTKNMASATSTPKGKAAATLPPATSTASNSFVSKPARGWLHPDYLFAKDGINYNVRVSFSDSLL